MEILDEIFRVRKMEERFERGEVGKYKRLSCGSLDGTTQVSLRVYDPC